MDKFNGNRISVYFYDGNDLENTDFVEFPSTWTPTKFKEAYLGWFIENNIPNYRDVLNNLWNIHKDKKEFGEIVDIFEEEI